MNSTLKHFSLIFCVLVIMVSLFALPKVYEFTVGNEIAPRCVIQPIWGDTPTENFFFSKVELYTYAFEVFLCAILAWFITITKGMIATKLKNIPSKAETPIMTAERIYDQS